MAATVPTIPVPTPAQPLPDPRVSGEVPSGPASRALASGVEPLDELEVFAPGRLVFLESTTPYVDHVLRGLVLDATALGRTVRWVEGAHHLDVLHLARAARGRGRRAEEVLDAVRMARGFTAYQVQALVEEHLPGEVGEDAGLVVAAGLPVRYLDEDVRRSEARVLLRRALRGLRHLARDRNVPVVATHRGMSALHDVPALRRLLHEEPDEVVRFFPAPLGARARLPARDEVVHCPAPGARQRRLPDFGVHVAGVA